MNNQQNQEAQQIQYSGGTTTVTRSVTRRTVQGYDEAQERYQLRKSAKSQQGSSINQQTTLIKSNNDDNDAQRQSRIVQEKYSNYQQNVNISGGMTGDDVIQKYQKDRGSKSQYEFRSSTYQQQEQSIGFQEMNTEYRNSKYVYRNNYQQLNEHDQFENDEKEKNITLRGAMNSAGENLAETYDSIKGAIFKTNTALKNPQREPNQVDIELMESDYVSCNLI